jgi:hypothetical protein
MPPLDLPAEIFYADELSLPGGRRFLFKYEPFELCCALKPYAIQHVIRAHGAAPLVYLDSDILVTNGFWHDLEIEWSVKSVLLTPHLSRLPLQLDVQSQRSLLQHGGYNGGFIGVKGDRDSNEFLNWWASLLEDHCTFDPMKNLYVDQRWLDLFASSSSGHAVLRNPGFNVAYWNLHERKLEPHENGTWYVNGQPVRFFHFSGFDRGKLTTKINCRDPMALKFAGRYGDLLDQFGEQEFGRFPYGWGHYANGQPILSLHRDLILTRHPELESCEDPFSLPCQAADWGKFHQILNYAQPARITARYSVLEQSLLDCQKRLEAATATLRRLRDHRIIGRFVKLWRRFVNPSIDSDWPDA